MPPLDPSGTARPTIRTLKTLAAIYGTTWEQLVDLTDLQHMPAADGEGTAAAEQETTPLRRP